MALTNPELRHLRSFVVLAEELHFARAARRLHVSQPALSQTLKQLEHATGLRLVNRTTRRVELTSAGASFRDDAERVLNELDRLIERAGEAAAGRCGTLHVGFTIGAAVDLVPRILREYAASYPDVKVELQEFDFSEPEAGLNDDRSEVAFVRPPIETEGVQLATIATECRIACMPESHPLADHDEISIHQILSEPLIGSPACGVGVWRDYWLACDYRHGELPRVVTEVRTFEAELQAVASGRGISITAEAAARFYAGPGIRFARIVDIPPCEVAVALPPIPTPAARNFAEIALSISRHSDQAIR